jgi:hypothetical protein
MLNTSLAPGAGRILTGITLALLLAFTTGMVRAEAPAEIAATGNTAAGSVSSSTEDALPSAPMARGEKASDKSDADTNAPKSLLARHLALEAGGGMNFPRSAISGYNTTGYNGTLGAGWMFSHQFGTILEYQFIENNLTSYEEGALDQGLCFPTGTVCPSSGHAISNFVSVAPILYFMNDTRFNAYVTLGVGLAKKTTTTSETYMNLDSTQAKCPAPSVYTPVPISGTTGTCIGPTYNNSYSDTRLGYDFGIGVTYKTGWNSHVKYFTDIRYLRIDTTSAFGLNPNAVGRTVLAPFTVGLRY